MPVKKKTKPTVKAAAIPRKAADTIEARASERDTAEGEMTLRKAAEMSNTLLDTELSASQLAKILVIIKLVRSEAGDFKEDDYVDIAGYAGISGYHAKLKE